MRYYHRHSFFPLVIILLSLLLGFFIFLTVSRERPVVEQTSVAPVDEQSYREELMLLLTTFETDMNAAPDNAGKLSIAQSTFAEVIALRVPPEEKDLHLSLALALSNIQTALKGSDPDISIYVLQIQTITESL